VIDDIASVSPRLSTDRRVVWIVDDSPLEAEMIRSTLAPDFETHVFLDGPALLERIVVPPMPDVLVLDWIMAGVSGLDVTRFLRSHEATQGLSILLLTRQNQTQQVVEGLAAGADDYLSKPYMPEELIARVDALIRSRQMLEKAEAAERSMRALLAHLPDALITVSGTGKITFLNAEAERILAIQANGQPLAELFPALANIHHAVMGAEHFEALADVAVGTQHYAPAVREMAIDGVSTIAVTLRDVTEKVRLEKRRLDFYSMVAHDLRSPLAAMKLRIGMMKREQHGPLQEPYRADLEAVDLRIADLVRLINDFLDIARSEGVGLSLTRQQVDLGALVREHLGELDVLEASSEVKLRFVDPEVQVETHADPRRLKQVITNLVSNAVKFSSKGGEVLIEVHRRAQDVEFAVSDAGRGIAEDKISELFKRYARPGKDSAALPGKGLGLMVVREVIAAHGGTCGVESTLGKGSRFWVRLPHTLA
jgi:signal transduction histidine kinase